jgi:hypothetical protein
MFKLSDPKLTYRVPRDTVARSISFLQTQGALRHEGVVLWPGRLQGGVCEVTEPIIPRQITGRLSYRIPNDETFRIIRDVAERGLVIPIQIHSHPFEAFHSSADDEYAFVQHENALSIVVPDFAAFPLAEFTKQARVYRLRPGNEWLEVAAEEASLILNFEGI